ncbi:MAG: hypothetical protein U9O89_04805 [Thermoproteota archaeon]|nr:hypothetical protein [Thermoproteota archaeon]
MKPTSAREKNRSNNGITPVISTVITTGTIVVLLTVTLVFSNNFLWTKIAESDFNSAKQFMQTIGVQINDVAWDIGRTETVRYSTKYGQMKFLPNALNYTIQYVTESGNKTVSYMVGVLLFNIKVSDFSISDDYYQLIFPSSTDKLVFTGASAPAVQVFAVEKLGMNSENFIRVVVAPSIRALFSNITTVGDSNTSYVKLYLPILKEGGALRRSQSVTLTSHSINVTTQEKVSVVNVTVSFPMDGSGFNESFFHFPSTNQTITVQSGFVLEIYTSEVSTGLGVHP